MLGECLAWLDVELGNRDGDRPLGGAVAKMADGFDQYLLVRWACFQKPMDPSPRFGIVALRQFARRCDAFQAFQVRPPTFVFHLCDEQFYMGAIEALLASRHFEVLGKSFVEPEWQMRNGGVQVAMGHLVAKIFRNVIAPVGINGQPRIAFNEKRPPLGKLRIMLGHETVVRFRLVEQIDVDRFVGQRQFELCCQVLPLRRQFAEQPMIR